MKNFKLVCKIILLSMAGILVMGAFGQKVNAANPYLPLWEYIPDGEPYVFEDPENPGKYRAYIFGSHDVYRDKYCGPDIVAWSAPVENLTHWRYDGVIFESIVNGVADTLYAPDVVEKVEADGNKTYYLYPNNQGGGRISMVAKADSPIGPYEVINYVKGSNTRTEGIMGFDPAVFIDDDGRVYGYWGFKQSNGAELDPTTMSTLKAGTKIIENMIPHSEEEGEFRFFEASSMRKIKDKYVFIYSRKSEAGEFGLPETNCTLAYAYSDNPLGPWTYGGTIVDARSKSLDYRGNNMVTAQSWGNTHGSILEINGQWYVFYHRNTNHSMYSRQSMVSAINVKVEEGPGGKVVIQEAEVTSEGFEINGLNPYKNYSAGIACWFTGGAYIRSTYDKEVNSNPVVNTVNGSVVGYKYYNFDLLKKNIETKLVVNLIPKGKDGVIDILMDSPWESKNGVKLGSITISKNDPQVETLKEVILPKLKGITGKHSIFFVFQSNVDGEIAVLNNFRFATIKEAFTVGSEREEDIWISNDKVAKFIDEIGTVEYTVESMRKINQAKKAYDNLNSKQKASLINANILLEADAKYLEAGRKYYEEMGKNYTADIISNGLFENGTFPWVAAGNASIEVIDANITTYKKSLHVKERSDTNAGAMQDISGRLLVDTPYTIAADILYEEGIDEKEFQVLLMDGAGKEILLGKETIVKGQWGTISGEFRLPVETDLSKLSIRIVTPSANNPTKQQDLMDYHLDNINISRAGDQEAANSVITMIEQIGKVDGTDESKLKIDEARLAFDKLSQPQKNLVTNKKVLFESEMLHTVRQKEQAAKKAKESKETMTDIDDGTEETEDKKAELDNSEASNSGISKKKNTSSTILIIIGAIFIVAGAVIYFCKKVKTS